ncbi:MAG: hypothetical protein NTU99_00105 [Pseudanabaena sp. LacPavin_0818_WC45_MAG_42_6]|nr:hypothetical protein [Pseudanabaena sp. LacPavin_0818_WC45_MAG_42_6]
MKQVEIWRSQAAATLGFLVPKIVGSTINEKDGLVDDLVRVLNNLPARQETRQPYAGILPAADLPTWRSHVRQGDRPMRDFSLRRIWQHGANKRLRH